MKNYRFIRSVAAFMLRDMATSYGRHPGGFLWAFVEPIAAISLLTIVFSMAFRAPALGDNFALFYASGYLPFMLYSELSGKISQSIKSSRPLLMYPTVNFFDAIAARFLLCLVVHLVVFCVVIQLILLSTGTNHILDMRRVMQSLLMASSLGLGVGTLNCFLSSRMPVWDRIWSIANRPSFIIAGIFFTYESVPEPVRSYLWYNPLIHIVGEMRGGIYPTYDASYVNNGYVFIIANTCLFVGLLLLLRNHRAVIHNG